ncbi:MAG: hypothetical protein QXD13_00830 [Candidatus Pacearchaeota archaeon]
MYPGSIPGVRLSFKMIKEFRVVIADIKGLNVDKSRVLDFTDYYLTRNKRIRQIKDKSLMISAVPGSIIKKKEEIEEKKAKELIKKAILVIKKKGVGDIIVNQEIKGYCEEVSAFKGDKMLFSEIQIEFELDRKYIPEIKKHIKVEKLIEKGLFDYALEPRRKL